MAFLNPKKEKTAAATNIKVNKTKKNETKFCKTATLYSGLSLKKKISILQAQASNHRPIVWRSRAYTIFYTFLHNTAKGNVIHKSTVNLNVPGLYVCIAIFDLPTGEHVGNVSQLPVSKHVATPPPS